MMNKSGGIILAGGKSARMGQDKALLPVDGQPLIEHVAAILRPLVNEIVVVADSPEKYTSSIGRIVADLLPGAGPVGGILTGLTALGEGSHIVVACDMPKLNARVLQFLLEKATSEWDAVVPEIGGRPEPLCAVYRHTAAPKLRAFLDTGQRAAYQALDVLQTRRIDEETMRHLDPEGQGFTNLNTPEDLERFRQQTHPS